MLRVARTLGHPLTKYRKRSLAVVVGIADIEFTKRSYGHLVVLNRGLILDSDGSEAVPLDIYLKRERAELDALYVLKG